MSITFTNLGSSAAPDLNSTTDGSSYATSSWTPPTSGLILLFVVNSRSTDLGSPPTVSGNGINWEQIATVGIDPGANTYRLTLYAAEAAASTTGATTADFAGDTQTGCNMVFMQAEAVAGGTTLGFVQTPTNSGTGAASGTITMSAASNAENRPIACFFHSAGEATTPRPGWTEFDDFFHATPPMASETQVRSDAFDTTAFASWASATNWLGIAAELRAAFTYEDSVSVGRAVGITDQATLDIFKELALAALKTVSETAQIDFNPTIGFQLTAGVDPSVIQNLNTTVGLGKLLSVTVDGTLVGLVTKGFVVTLDFSTNPVSITSFRATNVEGSDS